MMNRLQYLVSIIFLQQYSCTTIKQNDQLQVHSYPNEILYGYSYCNITASSMTMQKCLQHCLSDCLCQSFQICGNTCQLCSTTGRITSAAVRHDNTGCKRFEFENRKNVYLNKEQCQSCTTGINCCLTSQPCSNNGICTPLPSNNTRFTCECADGYIGHRCTEKAKSCRAFLNENHKNGSFKIFDNNNNTYTVYCSFDSDMAWTLVQSFQFVHKLVYADIPIYEDRPRNQTSFQWEDYRLSKSRMNNIKEDSNSKWRFTCNFDQDGLVHTDYVVANHTGIPILPSSSKYNACRMVEFIDIRSNNCSNCKIKITQGFYGWTLHIDSYHSKGCSNHFQNSETCGGQGEDNFGVYQCVNKDHRCSSTNSSTTQLWFGGQ